MNILNHPQIEQSKQRYQQLEKRDRLALNSLSAFLGLMLVYFMVWSPANSYVEQSRQNYQRQAALLSYLRASEAKARQTNGNSSAAVSGQSLLSRLSSSAGRFNIKPNRLQPEGTDGVSVWFSEVGFNELIRWLENLGNEGFTVKQISIDRQEASGLVNARIILRS